MNNASAMPRLLPRAPPCIPWPAQGMGGGAWLKLKRIRSLRNVASGRKRSTVLTMATCSSSKKRKEEDSEKRDHGRERNEKGSPRKKIQKEIQSWILSCEITRIFSYRKSVFSQHLENFSKLSLKQY